MHHARVPSSKALHKHQQGKQYRERRHASPSPERDHNHNRDRPTEREQRQERPSMLPATHRRSTSDALRLSSQSRESSLSSVLKKNSSQSSLKRNRSYGEVTGKRTKAGANIKRSASSKEVHKLTAAHKSTKSQVHFDLGDGDGDGQTDEGEWVDASASASPYLSRRGSVVSTGQSSAKGAGTGSGQASPKPQSPAEAAETATGDDQAEEEDESAHERSQTGDDGAERERIQHRQYLTSRLLRRTPSHGAPPQMSSDTAQVAPHSTSPPSPASRQSSAAYGTPKTGPNSMQSGTFVGSAKEGLTSRFVSGNDSGQNTEAGSFYSPPHMQKTGERVKRPKSLGNLQKEHKDALAVDKLDDAADDSVLAPRSRRAVHKAPPADQTRTQQKLNLQRASSSMEPTQAGGGVGSGDAVLLLCFACPLEVKALRGSLFADSDEKMLLRC